MPEDVDHLFQMCQHAGITYKCEHIAAVAHSIFFRPWKKPRALLQTPNKESYQRQQGRCAGCKEEFGPDAELDRVLLWPCGATMTLLT